MQGSFSPSSSSSENFHSLMKSQLSDFFNLVRCLLPSIDLISSSTLSLYSSLNPRPSYPRAPKNYRIIINLVVLSINKLLSTTAHEPALAITSSLYVHLPIFIEPPTSRELANVHQAHDHSPPTRGINRAMSFNFIFQRKRPPTTGNRQPRYSTIQRH